MKFVVNFITSFRLLYTFVLPIIKAKTSKTIFLINIILLFLTDSLDGILARKFKVQTYYGAILDTIADKALSIVLILMLIPSDKIFLGILLLEILIGVLNSINFLKGKETRSSMLGKIKTWLLAISIVFGYMRFYEILSSEISQTSSIIACFFQVITLLEYCVYLVHQPNTKKRDTLKIKNKQDLKYFLFDTEYYLKNSST